MIRRARGLEAPVRALGLDFVCIARRDPEVEVAAGVSPVMVAVTLVGAPIGVAWSQANDVVVFGARAPFELAVRDRRAAVRGIWIDRCLQRRGRRGDGGGSVVALGIVIGPVRTNRSTLPVLPLPT